MTTTNEIERVILNLEDRITELQGELQLAYVRAQNAVEDAERERDERDETIARLTSALEKVIVVAGAAAHPDTHAELMDLLAQAEQSS